MSNTAADSYQSTVAASKKRSVSPIVWLVVLIVAALAFGAAVVWAGGVNEALNMVGLGTAMNSAQLAKASVGSGSTASTSTPGSQAEDVLPPAASEAMYREQLESQANIARLVNDEVESLTFGDPDQSARSADVPVTVKLRAGSSIAGSMKLKSEDGIWYFFSLTSAEGGGGESPQGGSVDPAVVSAITEQQASATNQEMIKNGLLGGGYRTARVTGVTKGSGTATVNLVLSGGSEPEGEGEFLCIQKKDGSTTYWFITRFSAK